MFLLIDTTHTGTRW